MASFLRPKLTCFYCGKRQSKARQEPSDAWKCRQCDAVNYLDKVRIYTVGEHKTNASIFLQSGQIADPPVQETSTTPRFAQRVPQSNPAVGTSTSSSSFCSTCLKNQRFYTEALANYLPAPEDPRYGQYEASLDDYKRALEERYPQVCVACEDRVAVQIQRAGYAAKADHLRRLMDKSRRYGVAKPSRWKVYILHIGLFAFHASIFGQIAWSVPNALLMDNDDALSSTLDGHGASGLIECARQICKSGLSSIQCSNTVAPVGGVALLLGLLSLWWNPKWQHKLEGRRGRLRGLKDFYQLQVGGLVFRFLAWVWLQSPRTLNFPPSTIRAFHVILIATNVGLVLASRLIVKVELMPIFAGNESVGSLVPESVRLQQLREKNPEFENKPVVLFPISKLAPSHRTLHNSNRIPTPPPEEIPDVMEWEPSHNIQPRIQHQTPTSDVPQRSPFHGRLPPAPSNRLLNLHPGASSFLEKDSIGIPQGFFDPPAKREDLDAISPGNRRNFAEPSFFPPSDFNADTGLENVFGKVFSLQDQPTELQEQSTAKDFASNNNAHDITMVDVQSSPTMSIPVDNCVDSIHLVLASLLAISFCLLVCISAFSSLVDEDKVVKLNLGITALASLAAIYALQSRTTTTKDAFLCLIELFTTIFIGLYGIFYSSGPGGKLHMLQSGFISVLAWQEFYLGMSGKRPRVAMSVAESKEALKSPLSHSSSRRQHQTFQDGGSGSQPGPISQPQQQDISGQNPSSSDTGSSFNYRAPYSHISSFRSRSNSIASLDSSPDSDASTIVTQTSGFITPNFQHSKKTSVGWSPGTGLRSLNLDDGPPSGRLRSRNKRF